MAGEASAYVQNFGLKAAAVVLLRSVLDFYRESPDWVKAVWVLSLPAFFLGMSWIAAHYGVALRRMRVSEKRLCEELKPADPKDTPP